MTARQQMPIAGGIAYVKDSTVYPNQILTIYSGRRMH